MINKQGLWFLTLFSLILVLSIYYITMPHQELEINKSIENPDEQEEVTEVLNSNYITSLQAELESKREEEIKALEETINNTASTTDEKDDAYLKIKDINNIRGLEEQAAKKIKDTLSFDSYVEIAGSNVKVVISKESGNKTTADTIMKLVQSLFTKETKVTVKFSDN